MMLTSSAHDIAHLILTLGESYNRQRDRDREAHLSFLWFTHVYKLETKKELKFHTILAHSPLWSNELPKTPTMWPYNIQSMPAETSPRQLRNELWVNQFASRERLLRGSERLWFLRNNEISRWINYYMDVELSKYKSDIKRCTHPVPPGHLWLPCSKNKSKVRFLNSR